MTGQIGKDEKRKVLEALKGITHYAIDWRVKWQISDHTGLDPWVVQQVIDNCDVEELRGT